MERCNPGPVSSRRHEGCFSQGRLLATTRALGAAGRTPVTVCRKALLPLPDRIRSHARIHLPGIGAVVLVSTIASCSGGLMPAGVSVALLVAAVGAGALWGGFAPAITTGSVALPAWWFLGLPFDLFLFGAFLLGGILLAVAGENAVRSHDRAGTLTTELAVMRRRLADEADVRRRAEEAEAALGRARHRFEPLVRSTVVPAVV